MTFRLAILSMLMSLVGASSGFAQGGTAAANIAFNGPTEYQYGTYYYAPDMTIPTTSPGFNYPSSSITSVYWQLYYYPLLSGQHAQLCAEGVKCIDISTSLTYGSTTVFNGLKNSQQFFIRYWVTGSGSIPAPFPVCGYSRSSI